MIRLLIILLLICSTAFSQVDDEYTTLLMHFDDDNFTDEWGNAFNIEGGITATTTDAKFGKCAYFDGTDDWLWTDSNLANYRFPGDFTIDLWVKMTTAPQYTNILNLINDSGGTSYWLLWFDFTDGRPGISVDAANSNFVRSTESVVDGNWNHIAITRAGNKVRFFKNGVITHEKNDSVGSLDFVVSGQKFRIGKQMPSIPRYFTGYMDELRISKGIARWTANFDPPTKPYGEKKKVLFCDSGKIDFAGFGKINFGRN